MPDIAREQEELARRYRELETMSAQTRRGGSGSPIWDEIDKIIDGLGDSELESLNQSQEYVESYSAINAILQREILNSMRPVVEATPDGRKALENHLATLKRLRNEISKEDRERNALINEYMTKYSDKTWKEFIEMKQGRESKK